MYTSINSIEGQFQQNTNKRNLEKFLAFKATQVTTAQRNVQQRNMT